MFFKLIYKDYLIIFYNNKKLKSFGNDQMILKSLNIKIVKNIKNKEINFILFDNFDIIDLKINDNDKYYNYLFASKLRKVFERKML